MLRSLIMLYYTRISRDITSEEDRRLGCFELTTELLRPRRPVLGATQLNPRGRRNY